MKCNMVTVSLFVTISAFLTSCADGGGRVEGLFNAPAPNWKFISNGAGAVFEVASPVQSAADKLYSLSFAMSQQPGESREVDTQSCHTNGTAVITVFSTNGKAQSEIDVKLDGSPIGNLTTYFPDEVPGCKTPTANGVITLMIPAGKHTLEAASPNLTWPSHAFSVEKCECMVLPLS
ncbi:MAG: hypothetical protein L0Z73_08755 [Gammaproteobacteria bacterium]|nr:hypothetical protein [Gammaproteobacteria bacterium]